jgi:hypothetical protein
VLALTYDSEALERHSLSYSTAAKAQLAPQYVLAGIVERVTFHKEDNGFCVLRVKA